jgi:hypothetical protein
MSRTVDEARLANAEAQKRYRERRKSLGIQETDTEREGRLVIQRRYEARRLAEDPEGFRQDKAVRVASYRKRHPDRAKAATKAWRTANRDRVNASRRRWRARNLLHVIFLEAKSRAKKRGVEFSIEENDIPPMGDRCPLLGHPFQLDSPKLAFSPSLDRIDPRLGYIKGNIWIVGYRANLVKNDGTAEEHEMIAAAMKEALR